MSHAKDELRKLLQPIVLQYMTGAGTNEQGALRDIITECLHMASEKGINATQLLDGAREVYDEEVEENKTPITFIEVTNAAGLKFNVRLVNKGDKYGLNNCLTYNETEPMVEFYDVRHPHTTFGQFVSRYNLSTLMEHRSNTGLILHGGVPDWRISAANMKEILDWLTPTGDNRLI